MKKRRNTHIFDKHKDGWYVEEQWCSVRLFDVEDFAQTIYDPACGGGNILQSAMLHRYRVEASDTVRRMTSGLNVVSEFKRADFLKMESRRRCGVSIVCNPPFDHVEEFCRKACAMVDKVAMIMLVRRLNAAHWLSELPLKAIYLLTPRPSMPPGEWIKKGNKPGGGTQDFCFLVFDSRYKGVPQLKWLHRDRGASVAMSKKCLIGRSSKPSRGANRSRLISLAASSRSTCQKS